MQRYSTRFVIAHLLALGSLTLSTCFHKTNPVEGPVLSDAAKVQSIVDSVVAHVEEVRGLSFLRPIGGGAVSGQHYNDLVAQNQASSNLAVWAPFFNRQLRQLGFVDDSLFDFFEQEASLFPNDAFGGYYLRGTDSIYVINYHTIDTEAERRLLFRVVCHELTHALQDQHFHAIGDTIASETQTTTGRTDYSTARRSLTEGDAAYTTWVYDATYWEQHSNPHSAALDSCSRRRSGFLDWTSPWIESANGEPEFWNYLMFAPYEYGSYRLGTLYSAGGWSSVNALYSDSAITMAQVIAGSAVIPQSFAADSIQALLGGDTATYVDTDNMGVFLILALLGNAVDSAKAAEALGWRGDQLVYVSDDSTGPGRFTWSFALADNGRAAELHTLLCSHVASRASTQPCPDSTMTWNTDSTVCTYTGIFGCSTAALVLRDNRVHWLENVGDAYDPLMSLLTDPTLYVADPPVHPTPVAKGRWQVVPSATARADIP